MVYESFGSLNTTSQDTLAEKVKKPNHYIRNTIYGGLVAAGFYFILDSPKLSARFTPQVDVDKSKLEALAGISSQIKGLEVMLRHEPEINLDKYAPEIQANLKTVYEVNIQKRELLEKSLEELRVQQESLKQDPETISSVIILKKYQKDVHTNEFCLWAGGILLGLHGAVKLRFGKK
jgi:hypothetical protein